MDYRTENQINMFDLELVVCSTFAPVWAGDMAFMDSYNLFSALI
jgi:hypothetical protein